MPVGMVLLVASLAVIPGCWADGSVDDDRGASPSASASATPDPQQTDGSPSPSPAIDETTSLEIVVAPEEDLLGSMENVRGGQSTQIDTSGATSIAIYVRCVGLGPIVVEAEGAATLRQQCAPGTDDPGTKNMVSGIDLDTLVVSGTSDSTNLWTVVVAAGPD